MRAKKILLSLAVTACASLSIGPNAVAVEPPAQRHCITVLDKLKPGERESRVIEHRCTDQGESEADLRSQVPLARALLLKHWDLSRYGGDSDEFYGRDGGCDAAGYGIPDLGELANKVSSFRSYGTCSAVTGYVDGRYGGRSRTWDNSTMDKPINGVPWAEPIDNDIESWWLKAG
ncbi:hypothetical protein [Streptomyces sp. I05A-00742]|uniref:hypothetical protein n=1 Tax=Streptomyces sp. I05A-00742 TaxID=2732853 RepID=UPI001488E275|nr:hypothetical protein [Streptomyces sp. I05A-00742]